jgi:hypothetical protein
MMVAAFPCSWFCGPFESEVQFSNITSAQCSYVSSLSSYRGVVSKIDPCTLNVTYYYVYSVSWKTDSKEWLLAQFAKDGIVPVRVSPYNGN